MKKGRKKGEGDIKYRLRIQPELVRDIQGKYQHEKEPAYKTIKYMFLITQEVQKLMEIKTPISAKNIYEAIKEKSK